MRARGFKKRESSWKTLEKCKIKKDPNYVSNDLKSSDYDSMAGLISARPDWLSFEDQAAERMTSFPMFAAAQSDRNLIKPIDFELEKVDGAKPRVNV